MKPYVATETVLRAGDYVVLPTVVVAWMPAGDRQKLRRVDEVTVNGSLTTRLRTMAREPRGGYYGFSFGDRSPPWRFSDAPLGSFFVFEVASE